MDSISQIYTKINEDMDKIEKFEENQDYDSALSIIKDQITFLQGYLTGEVEPVIVQILHSILRDRRILTRVLKTAKQVML